MSIKANLTTALELVNAGWAKGNVYDSGCYCLLGAIAAARTGLRGREFQDWHYHYHTDSAYNVTPEVELVAEVAATEFPGRGDGEYLADQVYRFNDNPDTQQADVVRVLAKAIEAAGE
ncbi:DUF6197 family protein [Nocardia grenadensis]|uniref:DUF6197 family protein n=2 Tax=Nocardia TaxID=1817 RepID=UPI0007A39DA9|nr:hypothetical protein [Nocardia grenadensis]